MSPFVPRGPFGTRTSTVIERFLDVLSSFGRGSGVSTGMLSSVSILA